MNFVKEGGVTSYDASGITSAEHRRWGDSKEVGEQKQLFRLTFWNQPASQYTYNARLTCMHKLEKRRGNLQLIFCSFLNSAIASGFESFEEKVHSFIFFTCGFSPGLRTGSVQWVKFWLFTFSKNYKSSDRGWVYQTKSVENKTWNISNSLKYDKSCGNQSLDFFLLTNMGISNKKCGKQNLKYLQFLEIRKMRSLVETNT